MLPYGNAWNRFSGWNSFMVIIPYRLCWKYCSVLCCLAMSDSVACYFQHLSPSVLTPFSCRLYFCGLRLHTENFSPRIPWWKCVCQQLRSTAALVFILISPREEEWNIQQWRCGVIILYCLILQILWFNCLSIYISAIDLCFFLVDIESRQKLDRQSCIKVNSWACSRLSNLITLSIKVRLKLNIFRQLLNFARL